MKKLFFTFLILVLVKGASAQCNTFYPLKENVVYEYDFFDKKDKLTLRTRNAFKNISGTGSHMKATMVQEMIDAKKGSTLGTSESQWTCDDGTLHFTMNSMSLAMDGGQSANMGAGGMSMDFTGDQMDIPSSLTVGQQLKDINYNVKMNMSGVSMMNRTFAVRDRKVEARESVTTPAGTFDAYKVSFTTTSKGGLGSGTTKSVIWYAQNIGLVKSENYKEDGKLIGRQLLTKMTTN